MDIDLSRFRETFFQEAAEHLETMEKGLLSLAPPDADPETLGAIFRAAHSMKAGAGMFGFEAVGHLTHALENVLDRMRAGEVAATTARIELLLRSVDALRSLVEAAARDDPGTPVGLESLVAELGCAQDGGQPALTPDTVSGPEAEYVIRFEPSGELFGMGMDPFLVLRDLARLGRILEVKPDLGRLPSLEQLHVETCYLAWCLRLATSAGIAEIRDVFAFVEDAAEVTIEPAAPNTVCPGVPAVPVARTRAATRECSIRVSTAKVDRLIDLMGELVIAQSMAIQIVDNFTPARLPRLREAMAELARYTQELQDRAMRIRMLPIGSTFGRFPRLVHDTAQALGKHVALEMSGEETELDKGVVEGIADSLTHLVRNAVDHGIESDDERRRAGKEAGGVVRLNAFHKGGSVIIEVSDDGRGLDAARIRAKAVERGLIGADAELSTEQVNALVFRAGFSTAAAVSDLSGRGVGLDVVKKGVEALNGTVTLESVPGRGTTFRIKLPLTLAIVDGLLLKVGEQTYVMPLMSIVETVQPRRERLRDLAGRGEALVVRQDPLRLLRLHRIFGIATEIVDPARGLAVVVEHEGQLLALLVDEVLGQQQVVVKSLETNFRKVEGIAGATILGDGRAALILDIAAIVAMSRGCSAAA